MLTVEWVLALMIKAEPAPTWRPTYERTAAAIVRAASADPLFEGDQGAEKTAALLVGLGWFESALRPDAEGDCTLEGRVAPCTTKGAVPHSHCLLQINDSNLAGLGTTRDELLTDVDVCVASGLRMMHRSFQICRAAPLEERLSWYASGGPECPTNEDARKKSKHRVLRSRWLYEHVHPAADAAPRP
jgi:hypothetical protein